MFAARKKFSDENKYSAKGSNGRRSESSTSRSSANSLWTGIATKAARPTSTLQRQCDKCDNEPISIQTKLTIGPVDDPYEREADQVAEQVMRKPASEELEETPSVETSQSNGPVIRRACDNCEENDVLKTNTSSNVDKLVQSPGSGSPLKDEIRSRIEPVLGADLSSVRVHNDTRSQQAASDINAKAFTHRNNVYLGPGQSSNDLGLMAHEATHTVQQGNADKVRKQPSTNPVLRPSEMLDIISRERAWTFNRGGQVNVDPRGVGRGVGAAAGGRRAGSAVFAVIQITDSGGRPVELSYGDHVKYGDPHAEQRAVRALDRRIPQVRDLRGGRMTVVLDQVPCPPGRQNCMGLLRQFARQRGLNLEIHLPTRERMRGGGSVTPRTAAMSTMRTDTPPVSLRRYYPDGSPPSSSGGGNPLINQNTRARTGPLNTRTNTVPTAARLLAPQPPSPAVLRAHIRVLGELSAETQRSIRMTNRINLAARGVTGLLGLLGAITTARNFQQMHAHGTIFHGPERQADQVVQFGAEMKHWAIDTTNNISLTSIVAAMSAADDREDTNALSDIEENLDQIYPQFQDNAQHFSSHVQSLRAREAALGIMKDYFHSLISIPMGASTAPNADAFAMSESLGRLQSRVSRAAEHFETARIQMQYYGDYLENLALQSNRMLWAIIFRKAAILTNEMERERLLDASVSRERNLNSLNRALINVDAELNAPICRTDTAELALRSRRDAIVAQIELVRRTTSY